MREVRRKGSVTHAHGLSGGKNKKSIGANDSTKIPLFSFARYIVSNLFNKKKLTFYF